MAKIDYKEIIYNFTGRTKLNKDIVTAVENSKEIRKEIARVFQQANRRIQNIERSGQVSPAVRSLHKEHITGFSKFSMSQNFEDLKIEYAKAVKFLQQPTSTARGAKQYGQHIRKKYDLTEEEYKYMADELNNKVTSVDAKEFVDKYLMRYKDFTGELEAEAKSLSDQMEEDARAFPKELQREIDRQTDKIIRDANREKKKLQDDLERTINANLRKLDKLK